jgi:hypothetical protein
MTLTVAEWHAHAVRAAGLDALARRYAENAKRLSRGEPVVWPLPVEERVSTRLAAKCPEKPVEFATDGREP